MAHVEKYTAGAAGHMLNHYARTPVKERGNENIKPELTALNWNAAAEDQPLNPGEFMRRRLKSVRVQNRKDVNVLCDWVVTMPSSLPDTYCHAFFEETYNFLRDRYGVRNVVSAYVHMDEVSPHMHFAFLPVTADQRRGGEKLCAKEVLTRAELQRFHTELQKALESTFGREVEILNEATKEGNKSVSELKKATAIEEMKKRLAEDAKNVKSSHILSNKLKVAKKGFGKNRHEEVTVDGQVHKDLVANSEAAFKLRNQALQWEQNYNIASRAADRFSAALAAEQENGEKLARKLRQTTSDLQSTKEQLEAIKADIEAVLDELPPPIQKFVGKKLDARMEATSQLMDAKDCIRQYFHTQIKKEFEFKDLQRIPLAYYDYGDEYEEYGLQVYADLKNLRIDRKLDGQLLDRWQFSSLKEMTEKCLRHLDWDKLTNVYENQTLEQMYTADHGGVRGYMQQWEQQPRRNRGMELSL